MSLIMEHEDAMRSMREHHLNFTTTSGAMEDSTKHVLFMFFHVHRSARTSSSRGFGQAG